MDHIQPLTSVVDRDDRVPRYLDVEAVRAGTPEERTRAQRIQEAVTGGGIDLLTNVTGALLGRTLGLG